MECNKDFTCLDDINNYYKNIGTRLYWTGESLSYKIIQEITEMFKLLYKLYPDVTIKGIGDVYSYDKMIERSILSILNKC